MMFLQFRSKKEHAQTFGQIAPSGIMPCFWVKGRPEKVELELATWPSVGKHARGFYLHSMHTECALVQAHAHMRVQTCSWGHVRTLKKCLHARMLVHAHVHTPACAGVDSSGPKSRWQHQEHVCACRGNWHHERPCGQCFSWWHFFFMARRSWGALWCQCVNAHAHAFAGLSRWWCWGEWHSRQYHHHQSSWMPGVFGGRVRSDVCVCVWHWKSWILQQYKLHADHQQAPPAGATTDKLPKSLT